MSEEKAPARTLTLQDLNERGGGWNRAMGLVVTVANADEVQAELTVGPEHQQGYGIVHGGVYAGIVETACSIGAALWSLPQGRPVVGLENSTSFLRAMRGGRLRVRATPLVRGRRSQVWEAQVSDDENRLVATGRVRLLCLEPETQIGGTSLELHGSEDKKA